VRVDCRRPLNGSTLSGFGVAFALQSALTIAPREERRVRRERIANAYTATERHNAHMAVPLPSPYPSPLPVLSFNSRSPPMKQQSERAAP